jgi:gliding motility-associated-like protein
MLLLSMKKIIYLKKLVLFYSKFSIFLLVFCLSNYYKAQSFVTWNEGTINASSSSLTSITGTYPAGTVTVTNTATGQNIRIGREFCTQNLNGAVASEIFGTFGSASSGQSKSLTFTFSSPVIINSFSMNDIDQGGTWYDQFTFSGVVFESVVTGNGVLANGSGTTFAPIDNFGNSCAEYANWFNSTSEVSSFTIDYAVVSGNSHAYLGYSLSVSVPNIFNIVGSDSICIGDSTLLSLSNLTGSTHAWADITDPEVIISTDLEIKVSPLITTTYAVYGDIDTAYHTVNVSNNTPMVNLGNDTTICQGQSISLNGGTAQGYLWSNGLTSSMINISDSGAYWLRVNNGACFSSDTIIISTIQYPILNLGNDTILCEGQSTILEAGLAEAYLWSTGSVSSSIEASSVGTYWVEANNGFCFARDSILISIRQYPTPNLGSDTTLCEGQLLTLDGGIADTYIWSNGLTTPTINVSNPSMYWVETSNAHCAKIDSIEVFVNLYPTPNFGNDTLLCEGQSLTLDGGIAETYLWSNGLTSVSINVSSFGTYWVESSNDHCKGGDTIVITFNSYPTPNLGGDTTLCEGQSLTLDAGAADTYLWSDGTTGSTIIVSNPSIYYVESSNAHCSKTDSIEVFVNEYPDPFLGNDTLLCQGQFINLDGGDAASYVWSTGSLSSSIEVSTFGTYWVEASNDHCMGRDTITFLPCAAEILIPNIFTPNNDGKNDLFIPLVIKNVASLTTKIFNRWGNEMFESSDLSINWNGGDCVEGTYFWQIFYVDFNGTQDQIHGYVTLIK